MPNTDALRRTIRRLRVQLKAEPEAGPRPREVQQMLAQVRQQNTELKHRLRQAESRSARGNRAPSPGPGSASPAQAELASENVRLKRQLDALKKELNDLTVSYDRLRLDSAREIAKWKASPSVLLADANNTSTASSLVHGSEIHVRDLRRRLASLERDLEAERLLRRKDLANHRREMAESVRGRARPGWQSSTGTLGAAGRSSSASRTRTRTLGTSALPSASAAENPRGSGELERDRSRARARARARLQTERSLSAGRRDAIGASRRPLPSSGYSSDPSRPSTAHRRTYNGFGGSNSSTPRSNSNRAGGGRSSSVTSSGGGRPQPCR